MLAVQGPAQATGGLLAFAGHPVVPVHEGAVGIVPPSPNMQLIECGEAITIRAVHELKGLAFQHRRSVVMCQPGSSVHDVLDAHQAHLTFRRFINEGFRTRPVDLTIAHQAAVDIVDAHGAVVRTADAPEQGLIVSRGGRVDVQKLPGCIANYFNEFRRRDYFGMLGMRIV